MWDDQQIDAAIDEAAGRMTAGEPSRDFRARVMARIDAGSRRSGAGLAIGLWRPASAGLAIAALIVIVLAISRDWRRPADRAASAPAPIVSLSEPGPASEARRKPDPTYGTSAARRRVHGADRAFGSVTDDDVPGVERLHLPSIDLDSIAVTSLAANDSIDIAPIPPAPSIAVTPLDVENEGDPR